MERNQKSTTTKSLEQLLAEHLKQDPTRSGDSLRFARCPLCNAVHDNNLAFVIDLEKKLYFGHCCGDGGSVEHLLGMDLSALDTNGICEGSKRPKSKIGPDKIYENILVKASKLSRTATYLFSRGIKSASWSDFDRPLKEAHKPYKGKYAMAVYPFVDAGSKIVAIQNTLIDAQTKIKWGRRYSGPKGSGVAILKSAEKVIVAEGLETGLSVRQHLGNEYGLIVCGDSGNLEKLAGEHSWAIESCKEIVVAADNDILNIGILAARKILYRFPFKTIVKAPGRPGKDWNDVLVENRMDKEWI